MFNTLNLIFVFIMGLVFGSFYNVVGYRLPNKESIAFPSSHCPNCNHKLKIYELIPVLSYVFLGGKCKKCKKRISPIYPLFEIITASLFSICYYIFGFSIDFFISITFISVLIIITISDIRYFIIPDEVIIIGSIFILIEFIIKTIMFKLPFIDGIVMPILNGLGAFAFLFLIKTFGDIVFKKESLGGGDVKLLFFIGFVLGFDMSLVSIFLASFIALPIAIIHLIRKSENVLAFGPFLSVASIIILLFQLDLQKIINFLA